MFINVKIPNINMCTVKPLGTRLASRNLFWRVSQRERNIFLVKACMCSKDVHYPWGQLLHAIPHKTYWNLCTHTHTPSSQYWKFITFPEDVQRDSSHRNRLILAVEMCLNETIGRIWNREDLSQIFGGQFPDPVALYR
jgi:hypothetical protein